MTDQQVRANEAILSNRTITLFYPADRKKVKTPILCRFMTEDEVRALVQGQTYEFVRNDGLIGTVKVTSIKTWRRIRPGEMEINLKYGLREHAKWSLPTALNRFVVRL